MKTPAPNPTPNAPAVKSRKAFWLGAAALAALLLLALFHPFTRIDTGQIGVVRTFNGKIADQPAAVGWHTTFTSRIDKYTVKEIPVQLQDLRPTTKENISLRDLDFEIQYSVNPMKTPMIAAKYSNMNGYEQNSGIYIPAYMLVEKQAKSVSADAVSRFEALAINAKRNELENIIRTNLQKDLDANDPDTFTVSRVTISNLLPDEKIQESIRMIADSENRKQVAVNKLEIAKTEAEENRVRSQSLDDKILAEKTLEALIKMGEKGNVVVVPLDFKGTIMTGTGGSHTPNSPALARSQ